MKKVIKNILMFSSYFVFEIIAIIGEYLLYYIFKHFNIDISQNYLFESIYLIIVYLSYMLFIIFIYRDELLIDGKNFKENGISLIKKYIPIYILGVVLMGISNSILSNITNMSISNNEQSVRETIKLMPIYMSFSVIIFAPIIEEIIFRKTFKNVILNKYLFILISGTIFGLIHISGDINLNNILMSLPYMIMGTIFAFIYYKSDNIFTTISLHSIHNTLLLILQFIGG